MKLPYLRISAIFISLILIGCLKEIQGPDNRFSDPPSEEDMDYNLLIHNNIDDILYLFSNDTLVKEIPADTSYKVNIASGSDSLAELRVWRMSDIDDPYLPPPDSVFRSWSVALPIDKDTSLATEWIIRDTKPRIGVGTLQFEFSSVPANPYNVDIIPDSRNADPFCTLRSGKSGKKLGLDYGYYRLFFRYWLPDTTIASGKQVYGWVDVDSAGTPYYVTLNSQTDNKRINIPRFEYVPEFGVSGLLNVINETENIIRIFADNEAIEQIVISDASRDGLSVIAPYSSRSYLLPKNIYNFKAKFLDGKLREAFDSCNVISRYPTEWKIGTLSHTIWIRNQTSEILTVHDFDTNQYLGHYIEPSFSSKIDIDTNVQRLKVLNLSETAGAAQFNPEWNWHIEQLHSDYSPPDTLSEILIHNTYQSVILQWKNPADVDFSGVEIYRSLLPFSAKIADSLFITNGYFERFTNTDLENYRTYYYLLFPVDRNGNRGHVTRCTARPAPEFDPPSPVHDVQISHADNSITLQWQIPDEVDLAGVRITRSQFNYPAGPTEGKIVFNGLNSRYIDIGISNYQKYYYSIFTFDIAQNFSQAYHISGIPSEDQSIPGDVQELQASISSNHLRLAWKNPGDEDLRGIRILQSYQDFPRTPRDGFIVFDQAGNDYHDHEFNPRKTYFYTIYAYDKAENFSSGITICPVPSTVSDFDAPIQNLRSESFDRQIRLVWENPSDKKFSGVMIRKSDQTYPMSPIDGLNIFTGKDTVYIDKYLPNFKTYYYSVFSFDFMEKFSIPIQIKASAAPDLNPPGEIKSLSVIPGPGSLKFTWLNPNDSDFQSVKILRKSNGYPRSYADGILIFNDTLQTVTDKGLTNDTHYFYKIYTCDTSLNHSTGHAYSGTPGFDDISPPQVEYASIESGPGMVLIRWQNPDSPDFLGTKIMRRTDRYPLNSSDGILIYAGQDSSIIDEVLADTVTYLYSIFTYDPSGNYGQPYCLPGKALRDVIPPADVNNVTVKSGINSITLRWKNPLDSDFSGVLIIRRIDRYPSSPIDGEEVYNLNGTEFTDARLEHITYYFTLYAYDYARNYSRGVQVPGMPLE